MAFFNICPHTMNVKYYICSIRLNPSFFLTFVDEAEREHYQMLLLPTKPTELGNICILFKCYLYNTNITEFK